jgi:hypothetical protein
MAIPEAFWYARVHTTVLKEAQLPKIWANRPPGSRDVQADFLILKPAR